MRDGPPERIRTSDLCLRRAKIANSVNAGDSIDYFIDYFNQGNGVAIDAVVEDNLPAGTTFVSADSPGVEVSPGVVRWNLGNISPLTGGRLGVTVNTVPGVIDGTSADNTVSVAASNAGSRVAQATTIERSHTELDVTIVANQDPVAAGNQETLTVTWANTGNQNTTNAVVTATLPADTSFSSATGGGSFNGTDLITWSIGNLAAGATGSATFIVNVASPLLNGTVLKSVASITAANGLPRSDEAPFMVSSTPVWVVSKSASDATVDAGGQVTFNIVLQNLGNEAATGVVVTDNLPSGLEVLSADNGGTVDNSNNSVTWNLGSVPAGGQPIALSLRARMVAANTTLTNVALLSSNELPPVSVSATVGAGEAQQIPALPGPALLWLMLALLGLGGWRLRPMKP